MPGIFRPAVEPMPLTAGQFGRFLQDDNLRWAKLARNRKIVLDSWPGKSMARNTQVVADPDAPPVTLSLARLVAGRPGRGWTDAVEREAHRTIFNRLGCAIGASRHDAANAALARPQTRRS